MATPKLLVLLHASVPDSFQRVTYLTFQRVCDQVIEPERTSHEVYPAASQAAWMSTLLKKGTRQRSQNPYDLQVILLYRRLHKSVHTSCFELQTLQ
jgi:hypothetical protein